MIFCQLQERVQLSAGAPLLLEKAARTSGKTGIGHIPLYCPEEAGVWKLTALDCAAALQKCCPGESIVMLGADVCYVHRVHADRPDPWRRLRTAAALAILLMGSALGLSWFHSDVDMPAAQLLVYRTLTGQEVQDARLITVPYCIGVALGVAVFYALPARKAATPLEVKLTAYQKEMEQTEGRDMPEHP